MNLTVGSNHHWPHVCFLPVARYNSDWHISTIYAKLLPKLGTKEQVLLVHTELHHSFFSVNMKLLARAGNAQGIYIPRLSIVTKPRLIISSGPTCPFFIPRQSIFTETALHTVPGLA